MDKRSLINAALIDQLARDKPTPGPAPSPWRTGDAVRDEDRRKKMEGRQHDREPAEVRYRQLANQSYGGNVYGDEKGRGWDRKISKEAQAAVARDFGEAGERKLRGSGAMPNERPEVEEAHIRAAGYPKEADRREAERKRKGGK